MTIEITDAIAHLSIEVLVRSYATEDYWDGNWVVAHIKVMLPGFQAKFSEGLHLSELHSFSQDLKRLYSELEGIARLVAMEGFLDLKAEIDNRGRIHWSVELSHPVGSGNEARLQFAMHSDQSYLPALLDQIEAVLTEFPIVGQSTILGERPPF